MLYTYKPHQWAEAGRHFERVFGTSIKPFFDGQLTVQCKRILINPIAFGEYIDEKHNSEEYSLEDTLSLFYGQEGIDLFLSLTQFKLLG